jgi:ABC-2 type transport system permease protein
MTASTTAEPIPLEPAESGETARGPRVPTAGWRVIAAKELGDHILSARFMVLLIILGLAAAIPLYFAADQIKSLAPQATGQPAIFLYLFTIGSADYSFLIVSSFVAIVAPLLGLAFSFDAINGERAEGTLPRLVSQPIYRDDVINGKFVAGLSVILIVLVAVVGLISGFGILRLGITPSADEIVRIVAWVAVTAVYVGLWLAFGLLLSVLIRRAATSALVGFGVWLLLVIFGGFIVDLIANTISPVTGTTVEEALPQAQLRGFIEQLLPGNLYGEITKVILDPTRNPSKVIPGSIGQVEQAVQQLQDSALSVQQSLLLVWPQIVALVALMIICFVAAYVAFMRQEVRA